MNGPADLLFAGGPVFTADAARSRARAVAVKDGRILAVGNDLSGLRGPGTEVVDLGGRLLVPGFIDSHVHPTWGGLQLARCWLGGTVDPGQYLALVRDYLAANPEVAWVQGGGWSQESFPGGTPTAAYLDRAVADRPAFLTNRDGHGAWANSAALAVAGITRDTPDPPDGRIEHDAAGNPTGTLHEGAMRLVSGFAPVPSAAELERSVLTGQAYLHSLGVTAWQDAIVGEYKPDWGDPAPAYRALADDGRLVSRVVGALWWDRDRGLEQLPELVERRAALTGGRFQATSVKIMADGIAENFTAALLEPYCDRHGHPTGNAGISFVEPELLKRAVTELDALGFQVHFHAIGDRAVRECLDAVEAARTANGWNDHRPHISHLQVVHPEDVPRFRRLGVIANLQMLWAALEPQMVELTLPFLGEPRASWQYPFGDLLRAGATLACGSDWSVSTPNPLAAVHVGVNRLAAPGEGADAGEREVFLPGQRLDLATALAAYTAGSAYLNHSPDSGTIAPGFVADLVLLDRDPFAVPASEIGLTRVIGTWVAGRQVYAP